MQFYIYPSLEGMRLRSPCHCFKSFYKPSPCYGPLPPVFHQGDLVNGRGPFLAGNPDHSEWPGKENGYTSASFY